MIFRFFITIFLVGLIFNYSCSNQVDEPCSQKQVPALTFAVAGHTYGNPQKYTDSLYAPFANAFERFVASHRCDFLVLTGDVVARSTDSSWGIVEEQLDHLDIPWIIAPGNHDLAMGTIPDGVSFSRKSPLWYMHHNKHEAFMVLNTSNPGWTLDSLQLEAATDFLKGLKSDSLDHLFVFTHQVWWQHNRPDSLELDSVRTNSFAALQGPSDFWNDLFKQIVDLKVETWFFAGDLGSDTQLSSYYEDHANAYHFYASGMGSATDDNFLIVSVYQNNKVDIEKINF